IAIENEILAEEADGQGIALFHLRHRGDRMPIAAQELAHRRAGTDTRQPLVLFLGQHDGSSSIAIIAVQPGNGVWCCSGISSRVSAERWSATSTSCVALPQRPSAGSAAPSTIAR